MKTVIPLSVPAAARRTYADHLALITRGTDRLFLFAGDQKLEHLNKDFFGAGIAAEAGCPSHLFDIASRAPIGVFAAQLGLIARYAGDYDKTIPYLVKVNGKTDLVATQQLDPFSASLCTVEHVLQVKRDAGLRIVGIGYTLYLGSNFESQMLAEAARFIAQAHEVGLLTVLWIYPRGRAVAAERSAEIIAGAAGVATCLGADFVKVNPPLDATGVSDAGLLHQAVRAAGNTGVICSGGASRDPKVFLQELRSQLGAGARGAAIGRNIHQKPLSEAVVFCEQVASIIYSS